MLRMVVNISPSAAAYDETSHVLNFSAAARKVCTFADAIAVIDRLAPFVVQGVSILLLIILVCLLLCGCICILRLIAVGVCQVKDTAAVASRIDTGLGAALNSSTLPALGSYQTEHRIQGLEQGGQEDTHVARCAHVDLQPQPMPLRVFRPRVDYLCTCRAVRPSRLQRHTSRPRL